MMGTDKGKKTPDVRGKVPGRGRKPRLGMWDELIERRITAAQQAGEFDDLPGKGMPLDLKEPYGELGNWLTLKILKDSGFVTDEVRYRKEIEDLKEELRAAESAAERSKLIGKINAVIRKLNTMGTNIRPTDIAPLSEDEVITVEGS